MIEKIALYLRQFIHPGQVTELRAFGVGRTLSGWFDGEHRWPGGQYIQCHHHFGPGFRSTSGRPDRAGGSQCGSDQREHCRRQLHAASGCDDYDAARLDIGPRHG